MKLLREPLVHFLLLGGVLFALFEVLGRTAAAPPPAATGDAAAHVIAITPELIANLRLSAQRASADPAPSDAEMQKIVDNYVREEILVREAVARQLDRDDTQIRRRLVQKMEFASGESIALGSPAYEGLKAKYTIRRDEAAK